MNGALERVQEVPRDMPWGVKASGGKYAGMRIGEIWFDAGPLLLKFIATAEKLSVQVHPDDEYAAKHETKRGGRGKTEMWHVMSAAPEARLALGFQYLGNRQLMTPERIRKSAQDGSIEDQLHWIPARTGDTYFVPAGTIHAIGAGLELCEVQQNSDITYRLFDYGRGRELHLEQGVDVTAAPSGMAPGAGIVRLPFASKYFHVSEQAAGEVAPAAGQPGHLIVLDGDGKLGGEPYASREVWRISGRVKLEPSRATKALFVNPVNL